jgi:hypothetical protein
MTGHQARSEALFYYFRLEDQFLRLPCKRVAINFSQESMAHPGARRTTKTTPALRSPVPRRIESFLPCRSHLKHHAVRTLIP